MDETTDDCLSPLSPRKNRELKTILEIKDCYVVVAEKGASDGGGIVFEQELHNADYESIKKRIVQIKNYYPKYDYGKCRIAKLMFIDNLNKDGSYNYTIDLTHQEFTPAKGNFLDEDE